MKKLLLSFLFSLVLVFPLQAKSFSDVTNLSPNYVSISYLSDQGILTGYADGSFKADQLVNRAEALKIVMEGIGMDQNVQIDLNNLFIDVNAGDWFSKYVAYAKTKGIISGNADGTFAATRNVTRAELLKMVLTSAGFNKETWENQQLYADVAVTSWYAPYMNYAGKSGLLTKDAQNKLYPDQELSRGQVAEIIYLMTIILKADNVDFLITQSQAQMSEIEPYVAATQLEDAKRATALAVDMTQQAIKKVPDDMIVLSVAKIARSYQFLVDAYLAALVKNYVSAQSLAEQASVKAGEALQLNSQLETVAKHLQEQAAGIIAQINV